MYPAASAAFGMGATNNYFLLRKQISDLDQPDRWPVGLENVDYDLHSVKEHIVGLKDDVIFLLPSSMVLSKESVPRNNFGLGSRL